MCLAGNFEDSSLEADFIGYLSSLSLTKKYLYFSYRVDVCAESNASKIHLCMIINPIQTNQQGAGMWPSSESND